MSTSYAMIRPCRNSTEDRVPNSPAGMDVSLQPSWRSSLNSLKSELSRIIIFNIQTSPYQINMAGEKMKMWKDEVVLCRASIGHTHLTHSYILKKDHPPHCGHCQCILTVRHILVECNHLTPTRNDIFGIIDSEFYSKF